MLSARDLTLRRGADPLFEQVNFTIYRGDRVGLTGANGTGKSSLFAAICGTLSPDRGDIELENRTIRGYSGNYSEFEQKRSEDLALQQALKARQTRRIAEITSFVNRFRAKATKARQAQSRLKMLERMQRIVARDRHRPRRGAGRRYGCLTCVA